ncbi:hypothetical protein K1719_011158 [Acacia pycnantha]|nr:hypothetical protein K1719_011158 [Acacia pycnantha]
MVKKLRDLGEKGRIDIFDLENDFYLVSFQHLDDYMEALMGGPWVILDAYTNVARWRPNFCLKNAKIESVVAWVRLPDLPAPLFDKKFLLNLGNAIGKAIRVRLARDLRFVLRDLKHRHRLDVVVILEPRVGGCLDRIIKKRGFKQSVRREAEGFSGGIWILWNLEELVVDVILLDEQFIHCNLCLEGKKMAFTAVYASPNETRRHRIWDILYNYSTDSHAVISLTSILIDLFSLGKDQNGMVWIGYINSWIDVYAMLNGKKNLRMLL